MNEHETASLTEYDCNAHCLKCPGAGFIWGTSKCFDRYHRVRACPAFDEATRPGHRALRPPMRPPDSVVCDPEPVDPLDTADAVTALPAPVTAFDIHDSAAVAARARVGFRQGRGMTLIAAELTRLNCPAPHGATWRAWDIRKLLLDNPRPARPKRAKMAA